MTTIAQHLGAGAALGALILLCACGKSELAASEDDEVPPCWVYEGLDEKDIKRMEAYCNAYAVCSDEDGEACSGPTKAMEP